MSLEPYPHRANCTGCPQCNAELAAVLRMNAAEHVAWLRRRNELHPSFHRYAAAGPDDPPTLESVFVRSGPPAPSVTEVLLPPPSDGHADEPPSLADIINDQRQKGTRV